jgi:asparagine synthase (glutamine-hydrolysing)
MTVKSLINQVKSILGLKVFNNETIEHVKAHNLTYLSHAKLGKLASICVQNEKNNITGIIIETGCALGGSAIVMAANKIKNRPLKIYDVFDQIPAPSDKDGDDVHSRYDSIKAGDSLGICGETYYGYIENLDKVVKDNFRKAGYPTDNYNVSLHKGLIQDTLTIDEPVALAHIDVDWYDPVYVSLERIYPKLSIGGSIVIDDYFDWSGCKEAVDSFFLNKKEYVSFDSSCGSLVITRIK